MAIFENLLDNDQPQNSKQSGDRVEHEMPEDVREKLQTRSPNEDPDPRSYDEQLSSKENSEPRTFQTDETRAEFEDHTDGLFATQNRGDETDENRVYDGQTREPVKHNIPENIREKLTERQNNNVSLQDLNEDVRDRQYDEFFDVREGFNDPYVATRPDGTRARIPLGGRQIPGRARADHVLRTTRFLSTTKGVLFNAKQSALQLQNNRRLMRIYDSTSLTESLVNPFSNPTRHVDSGSNNIITAGFNQFDSATGFLTGTPDVPKSSKYEDEIEQFTDGEGYLINATPRFSSGESLSGSAYRKRARQLLAQQAEQVRPDHYSRLSGGPVDLQKDRELIRQGKRDSFVGMQTRTIQTSDPSLVRIGEYDPDAPREIEIFDPYNPTSPKEDSYITEQTVQFRESQRGQNSSVPDNVISGQDEYEDIPLITREIQDGYLALSSDVAPEDSQNETYGYPVYEEGNRSSDKINAFEIDEFSTDDTGQINDDLFLEDEDGNRFRDRIPLRFYDLVNRKRIIFRSYLTDISVSNNPQWDSGQYAGRPEQFYNYGGNNRSLSVAFKVFPESEEQFEICWKKINYMQGLVYPSNIQRLQGAGSLMLAPFMRITVGDLFKEWPGFIESLDIQFMTDEGGWELTPGKQMPRSVDISIDYTLIEKQFPNAGDAFFDADFLKS